MREDMDPRIDKMIAFLYGELSPAEEQSFRQILEKDAALRADFEELSQARGVLAGWKVEERVPSFVLVDGAMPRSAPVARPARPSESVLQRVLAQIRSFGASPAWGMAAAAVALAVLAGAGFRVERVAGGLAFRFGGAHPTPSAERTFPGVGDGVPLELAGRSAAPEATASRPGVVPVSGPYLTHDEFNSYNSQLMSTLAQLLNQYDQQRDREVTDLMQALYRQINDQQVFNYERVNRRIDALGDDLQTQTARNASLQDLLKGAQPAPHPTGAPQGAGGK
ncbi:MAG: hypothetical protein U0167_19215 [bacterium]